MTLFSATTGIRGPAETFFTDHFCRTIGYTFGYWLKVNRKQGSVAVAMDPRESSPRIKNAVCQGLAAAGWTILDQGVIPTPALTIFVKNNPRVAGGIMITGSHIVANLNGLKFLTDGEEISKIQEKEIEKLYDNLSKQTIDKVSPIITHSDEAQENYIELCISLAELPIPKWKIVLDTANGTQSEIATRVFKRLGIKIIEADENDIQAPNFVPRDTDVASAFTEMMRRVLLEKADFGIAFDVDGDRAVFIDNKGRFVPGEYSCALIAKELDTMSIVTPISSSAVVDHIGKKVYRTAVGATNVIAKMKETGSKFGFESNGGGIFAEIVHGRDGMTTVIKMLNLLKKHQSSLADLCDGLPPFYMYKEKTDCPVNKYDEVYAAVTEKFANKTISKTDGMKIEMGTDEWLLFRGSSTAPEFRLFIQSPDKKNLQKMAKDYMPWLKSIIVGHHQPAITSGGQDSTGVLESIRQLPAQCRQVLREFSTVEIPSNWKNINNIVVSGMGGSALGGRILKHMERQTLKVSMTVSTEYHLPEFVNSDSLVIISSYSGNTEETLASLKEAQSKRAQIFIIASGGLLKTIAINDKIPHYIFTPTANPSNQPRMGLGYAVMSLVCLLARLELINLPPEVNTLPGFLEANADESESFARETAKKIKGRTAVILASEHLKGVAHAFKNQLNENAKSFAVAFDLPEVNHHLLEGLTYPESNKNSLIGIFFQSTLYHRELTKRYPVTAEVFSKLQIPVLNISATGPSLLHQAMYQLQLCSFISYYLSQEYGIDPGPIPWVNFFKDQVGHS